MGDFIDLQGLEFYAYHGVFPEEQELGQIFRVNLRLYVDLQKAGQSDDVLDTVHYGEVYEAVKEVVTKERFKLIERLAEKIAEVIFTSQARVLQVRVCVEKPNPPIPGHYDHVAVTIERSRPI